MTFSMIDLVLLVAGIALGVILGHFTSPSIAKANRLRQELDDTLREHETYKASVNTHFRKTADLVGEMTKSYAKVYDHLAGGARQFCDGATDSAIGFSPFGTLASPELDGAAAEEAYLADPAPETNGNYPGDAETALQEADLEARADDEAAFEEVPSHVRTDEERSVYRDS